MKIIYSLDLRISNIFMFPPNAFCLLSMCDPEEVT